MTVKVRSVCSGVVFGARPGSGRHTVIACGGVVPGPSYDNNNSLSLAVACLLPLLAWWQRLSLASPHATLPLIRPSEPSFNKL